MATLDKIVLVLISNTGCPQHYKLPLSAIGIAVPKPEVSSKCLQIIAASPQNPKYSEDLQALDIKIQSYCIMIETRQGIKLLMESSLITTCQLAFTELCSYSSTVSQITFVTNLL